MAEGALRQNYDKAAERGDCQNKSVRVCLWLNMSRFVLFACNAFAKQIEDDMTEEEKQACEKRIDNCVKDYLKMINEKDRDSE